MDHENVHRLIEHFFRHESGRVRSRLVSRFGAENIDLIDDAVNEGLLKAMQTWPFYGIPDNPSGWIYKSAQNYLYDQFRKNSVRNKHYEILGRELGKGVSYANVKDVYFELDDVLRVILACCRPQLSDEQKIILTLKIISGFSNYEIGRALLKGEGAIARAYTRAKAKFKKYPVETPNRSILRKRLGIMLKIIYLIFNEGYNVSRGDHLIRHDLCEEALRLAKLVVDAGISEDGKPEALIALMLYHISRFESRISENGLLLTLENQDRSKWDRQLIAAGNQYLVNSTRKTDKLSTYHLMAMIAGVHCNSPTFGETDWGQLLQIYNMLVTHEPSWSAKLNRVIVMEKVFGPEMAIEELSKIHKKGLDSYYLYHAIKGDILISLGKKKEGLTELKKATDLTTNQVEKQFLKDKLSEIER